MSPLPESFERGWEHHQARDYPRAEEIYRRILRSESRNARVWFALAQLCDADRRPVEAVACFRQALEIEPREPEGHFQLGNALAGQKKYTEAEASFRRCVQLKPDHVAALVNLGYVLGEMERFDDARGCYEQALHHRPDLAEAHHNLGNVLREQGHLDQAMASYDMALRFRPEYAKAHVNRGVALVAQGKFDEAIASLNHGVELTPDSADAHTSLGAALCSQHRFDEALAHYDRALQLDPGHAEAAWNRALVWLQHGDYERGWPAYESRWRCKKVTPLPAYTQPRWDGSPLDGRTILLYGEQGLGDTLQFARYAPMLRARGGRVILQCQNALLPLLTRTPGIDGLVGWGATPPPFDVWTPLMSLPFLFGTTLQTVPAEVPYIFPDPDLVAHWARQLSPVRGFRIGIGWQGSPRNAWDRHRSCSLEQFEPLARIPGVHLISLQKGLGSEQLRALGGRFPVLNLGELFDEASGPFMDSAAIVANLDLVICVCTSLIHLAGAMKRPSWIVLNFSSDWRWVLGREDSPWYPTVRLFRQTNSGDWAGVFRRMATELPKEIAARPPRRPVYVEVPPGELLDKITILEIKSERIGDEGKLRNVQLELKELTAVRDQTLPSSTELTDLATQLKAVNERLWEIEDEIRICEREQDFGLRFVELARSVYHENDRRAALKRAVNELLHSRLIEEKSYTEYHRGESVDQNPTGGNRENREA
jgi:tetratricopeptide (TPR) repeat protein